MRNLILSASLILTTIILNSCSIFHGGGMSNRNSNSRSGIVRVKQFTNKPTTLMWAHHDPTQRQTLMYVDTLGNIKVLAEQSPDAGISNIANLSANAKLTDKLDAATVLNFQAQLEKLTNRTTSLMITRENLYAIRELCFNNKIVDTQAISLYNSYFSKIVDIVKEDAKIEEAKAKVIQAEVEKAKIELEKLKIETANKKLEEENKKVKTDNKEKSEDKKPVEDAKKTEK
ncbi:hypothetical protein [Amniculibacterium aquaticum]|uniref:hypothetical protein n=1 Tax=Amniculibacterium aquaticum TaxID=2479858 RepID=UPI000F58FEAC|nr:hypothetical protein [Amniculibacterium aquaticum]